MNKRGTSFSVRGDSPIARTLKLEFDLSEEQLEALKEELIEVQELAVDKDGKMLVGMPRKNPNKSALLE